MQKEENEIKAKNIELFKPKLT